VPAHTPRKYCSASCRARAREKQRIPYRLDLALAFRQLLDSPTAASRRGVVLCSDAERAVFKDDAITAAPNEIAPQPVEPERTAQPGSSSPNDAREEARRAARRIVAFGWVSQGVDEDRAVQAVQDGKEVETSFAKGEWGLRWRSTP
jgi:hypothetical protein